MVDGREHVCVIVDAVVVEGVRLCFDAAAHIGSLVVHHIVVDLAHIAGVFRPGLHAVL